MVTALFAQDMYLAGTYVLIAGVLTSTGSLVSDVLLAAFDPRTRFARLERA